MTTVEDIHTLEQLQKLKGNVLVTGATGSGKTTLVRNFLSHSLEQGEVIKYIDHSSHPVDIEELESFIHDYEKDEKKTIVIDHYFDNTFDYMSLWENLEGFIKELDTDTRLFLIQQSPPMVEQLEAFQNVINLSK